MNPDNAALACGLVSKAYIAQGAQALARRQKLVKSLLSSRRLPTAGWDDDTIEMFVRDCAAMDSNNFLDNVGVGEREARVACGLVARRHYGLAHGIGRSGDVAAEQPKAAGSSLLAKLANLLVADAMRAAGLDDLGAATLLPLATGMAITATLLALRPGRPQGARHVIWSRIDQKTCLKAITAAGLEPVVIELKLVGDQLETDTAAVDAAIVRLGRDRVFAVVTTTSCFAPRAADDVVAVAKLCAAADVPHVINNAYGVQSAALCKQIASAWRKGRVDAVVQSTDKNFMVPVGGAVVAAGKARPGLVDDVNRSYPGRASMAAHLDVLMTLLHWGRDGWLKVLREREELVPYLRQRLAAVAAACGEKVLDTPGNTISVAMTLDRLPELVAAAAVAATSAAEEAPAADGSCTAAATVGAEDYNGDSGPSAQAVAGTTGERRRKEGDGGGGGGGRQQPAAAAAADVTFFGSMLWSRCVSGTRVVPQGKSQKVAGIEFLGYGSHCDAYPHVYLTAAAAVGTTREEVDAFADRLAACVAEFGKKVAAAPPGPNRRKT